MDTTKKAKLKEVLGIMTDKNNNYAVAKIEEIATKVRPFLDAIEQNDSMDESAMVFIYYRKGTDIHSCGYGMRRLFSAYTATADTALLNQYLHDEVNVVLSSDNES